MNEKELARAVAQDLGAQILAEVENELAETPAREGRRAYSPDETTATAGFIVAAAHHAMALHQQSLGRDQILTALAEDVERLPDLAGRLDPERRLDILAQLVDRLMPEQATRSLSNDPSKERRRWLQDMIGEDTRKLSGPPILQGFADMDYFVLHQPIFWERPRFARNDLPYRVAVPQGFVTDLASVPSLFWSFIPPQGRYAPAAILHDWLYWQQPTTREVADQVFLVVMEEMEVPVAKRRAMWASVRVFGGIYWEQNFRERASGGRRVLKKVPADMRTTWALWRDRPDVFATEPARRFT
jgi:hypothetical protein